MNWKQIRRHLNKPIICKFQDHAMGSTPIVCKVVGYLAKIEDDHIMLVSWDTPGLETESRMANMEWFSILKSTILDVILLEKKLKK